MFVLRWLMSGKGAKEDVVFEHPEDLYDWALNNEPDRCEGTLMIQDYCAEYMWSEGTYIQRPVYAMVSLHKKGSLEIIPE